MAFFSFFFFFKQKTAYDIVSRDWSSDVCSSDLRDLEGQAREITWPEVEFYEARIPRAPRDLILLSGVEPSMRWRTFCASIVDLAEALGVQLVVTLGALLADVAHSAAVPITGLASDESLVDRLGL